MMWYKVVFELNLKIYARQFMTSVIIPLQFVLLNLESVQKKAKNYKNISSTKSAF